jgi:hypothetical protein
MPLDARETHVVLFAKIELLIDAPMQSGDLALDRGHPTLQSSDSVADAVEPGGHVGAQVAHALDNKRRQFFDCVDLLLLRSSHITQLYHAP